MKRVSPGTFDDFKSCELFLDDVEKIAGLIASLSSSVTIQADHYEFASVADLTLLDKPVAEEIQISNTPQDPLYVYFELRPYLARLYRSNIDDLRGEAVAAAVRNVVEQRGLGPRVRGRRFAVLLRRSTDPGPPAAPGFAARNPQVVAAIVGGIVGAASTAAFTILLVWLGVLRTGA